MKIESARVAKRMGWLRGRAPVEVEGRALVRCGGVVVGAWEVRYVVWSLVAGRLLVSAANNTNWNVLRVLYVKCQGTARVKMRRVPCCWPTIEKSSKDQAQPGTYKMGGDALPRASSDAAVCVLLSRIACSRVPRVVVLLTSTCRLQLRLQLQRRLR